MLNKVLENVSTIAIGGHIRPDGDCVGACVGLGQYIRENYSDKTVDIYLKDIPESFHFLNGTETILESVDNEEKIYDLFISLDCGDTDRLEYSKPLFVKAKHTFCVDHHISNIGFAEVNHIVPEASSTSELVYGLLDEEKISKNVAEALYLGIVHDTGVFQYSCAGPETFRVAAKLLEKGIDAPKIIEETFYAKSYAQNLVMGRALMEKGAKVHIIIQDEKDGIRDDRYLSNSDRETCLGQTIPLDHIARLQQRCDAINRLTYKDKEKYKRAIFIHVDSRGRKDQVDVFFYHSPGSKLGKRLAENIHKTFERKYDKHQPNRGFRGTVSERSLYVLKKSNPEADFLELGNLQNERDRKRLVIPSNRQALADWICQGIIKDFKGKQ